ncbi:MAG: hypothetical protein OEZ31_06230 [Nitrospirota bacterium]|nr:hypothetical protein [Nitrospirota bacterium]
MGKEGYHRALRDGKLSYTYVQRLLDFIRKRGMTLEKISKDLLRELKITGYLCKLELYKCRGNRSWEGLVVGFPGTIHDLTPEYIGTPYLRKILYPMLDLHMQLNKEENFPCLYILGSRFNDVFLRKFRFLNTVIPHVIVLSEDLRKCAERKEKEVQTGKESPRSEHFYQKKLCDMMSTKEGLKIYTDKNKQLSIGSLSYEFPTVQATEKLERLDILGYDLHDHSLVAFELKGPEASEVEMENLFFQGMEHRDWLEENKMAVKFAFEGPGGQRIHTRKRVKLLLGFFDGSIVKRFEKLRTQAIKKDKYMEIYFCKMKRIKDKSGTLIPEVLP